MSSEIRLWKIEDNSPRPIDQSKLNMEDRLEEWLCQDIGMVNEDLLVIGQQVRTAYDGRIDLLAIDAEGNLVILELKRDKTTRDIVAQALDYASWVQDLGYKDVVEIASNSNFFGEDNTLEQVFTDKFGADFPEVVNESHRIYIVSSSLDLATARIVEYLSETHSVDINVATFTYFKMPDGSELLGLLFLLDEQEVERRSQYGDNRKGKHRPPSSLEELRSIAEENGVSEPWDKVIDEILPLCDSKTLYADSVSLRGQIDSKGNRNWKLFTVHPDRRSHLGLRILISSYVLDYFHISVDEIRDVLKPIGAVGRSGGIPEDVIDNPYWFDKTTLDNLIELLRGHRQPQI